jgi:hypothetical protein
MNTANKDRFINDILDVMAKGGLFEIGGAAPVEAVTQTDLMAGMREKGWKLPPAGFFWSEVQAAGFRYFQPYQVKGGRIVRVYRDGSRGRALRPYNTIYTL